MERIKWIDNYKGYLLLMVVLCHINCHCTIVDWSVTFFMPAFFFISGYLFRIKESDTFLTFTKRKFKALMIPYLWCNAIALVIPTTFLSDIISGCLSYKNLINNLVCIVDGTCVQGVKPMWFVYVLFLLEIIVFLFEYCKLLKYNFIILFAGGGISALIFYESTRCYTSFTYGSSF